MKSISSRDIEMLESMENIRATELRISSKYNEGKMRCPVHLSVGQEAVSAAVSVNARKTDYAVSTHRGHAHYLGKGGCPKKMIAEIYGKVGGCSRGRGGSMHLIDLSVNFMGTSAIVGNSIPIGVGLGLSAKLRKEKQISIVFIGDGATEEGVFYESINFAILKKLPVIFICENNLYSVYSGLHARQPKGREIYKMVAGLGMMSMKSDGNDANEADKAINESFEYARNGEGPCFIEFPTYRWLEHCGPNYDNSLGYRSEKEFESWKKKDPIDKLKNRMLKETKSGEGIIRGIKEKAEGMVDIAFQYAEKSDFPKPDEAFEHSFASLTHENRSTW